MPGEREQQGAGDLRDLRAAVALALGAQPRLRHVHEPAGADDLVAGEGDDQARLAVLAHVDARIRERERPVGARGPVLLLGGDEPQRCGIRSKRVATDLVRERERRFPATGARPAALREARAGSAARRRSGSIVIRHSSARAATSPSNIA